jgi:ATP-dependent Clp protease ATP-binding subunit ClpA
VFNPQLENIFQETFEIAGLTGHASVTPEHLLIHLVDDPEVSRLLGLFNVDINQLLEQLNDFTNKLPKADLNENAEPQSSNELIKLVRDMKAEANLTNRGEIKPLDVIVEMLKYNAYMAGC